MKPFNAMKYRNSGLPALPSASPANTRGIFKFEDTLGTASFANTGGDQGAAPGFNGCVTSNAQFKWGAQSVVFNGSNSRLNPNANYVWAANQFWWEAWIYPTSLTGTKYIFSPGGPLNDGALSTIGTSLVYRGTDSGPASITAPGTVLLNAWNHIAVGRGAANEVRVFLGGLRSGPHTDATNYAGVQMRVGYSYYNTNPYAGYMDEMRVLIGQCLTLNDFAVPTGPY